MMVYKCTVLINTIQRKISSELGKTWKKWLWCAPKYITVFTWRTMPVTLQTSTSWIWRRNAKL